MNIIKFLEEFTTENLTDSQTSRREMFGSLRTMGKKAAMVALPLGLAGLGNKAWAAPSMVQGDPVSALQLALLLEYIEADFYIQALECGVMSGHPKAEGIYHQISKHESAHVALLQGALGDDAFEAPTFDFTVGGKFDPFGQNEDIATSYAQLLAFAQAFEDTGVRAYKGQAENVMGNPDILTVALQIHSVEARHASEIRRLRGLEGWITGNERGEGIPVEAQAVYVNEENVIHGGVDVTTLGSGDPFSFESSTQAYDEPLTSNDAGEIASLFLS